MKGTVTGFAIAQLILLVLWSKEREIKTRASVTSLALTFVGSGGMGLVSYAEHLHSVKPSILLNAYLFASLILDATRTRTLWLIGDHLPIAILLTVSLGIKLFMLLLEATKKRNILQPQYSHYPPEAISGFFGRTLFLWLNPLFAKGSSQLLVLEDLFELDKHLRSEYLSQLLRSSLEKVPLDSPKASLLLQTIKAFKWPLLYGIIPRLFLIGFTFSQPFLIERAVTLSLLPVTDETTNWGYGLIGAYAIVYIGIAISTGQYQHHTFRAITMMRGGLVSLVYDKTASLAVNAVEPGASVTLMNTDMEKISAGFQFAHDLWASLIEIALATYLLERQLGAVCAIPLGVAILSIFASAALSGFIVARQKLWLEAIEKRIAVTTAMLGSMKGVKLCGLSEPLSSTVQNLRVIELQISEGFRKLLIWALGFTYISPVSAPILTFTAFAVMVRKRNDDSVDPARVFTSLSLFVLIATPLGSFIMALTSFMGAVGCFERLQKFLGIEKRVDPRIEGLRPNYSGPSEKSIISEDDSSSLDTNSILLNTTGSLPDSVDDWFPADNIISIHHASFGWDKEKEPILTDIDLTIQRERTTAIIGPVGCGKSTLLQAFLGEVPVFEGFILSQPSEYAYCQQTPWLMNGTIQESIIGVSKFDPQWYDTVVRACCLEEDFQQLPQQDRTHIGSKGIALSGGQSQRVALARAVYAKKSILVLDDVFRGLDTDTENRVFNSLFGREGLLRRYRATVIFTTSATNRLPYADHIIALNSKGQILEQGSFDDLSLTQGYVSSFTLAPAHWDSTFNDETDDTEKHTKSVLHAPDPLSSLDPQSAEASRRTGDIAIYSQYIKSVGRLPFAIFIVTLSIFAFAFSFPTLWVKWWAEDNAKHPNARLDFYLGIYGLLGGASLLFLVISCWLVIITMVPKSGEFFHWAILKKVIDAPMSFFSSTDTGVTLNRFSQDLQLIDMELPVAALNTCAAFILCIAQLVLIAVSSKYAAISFPFCILAFYLIQKFYLRTSRQLRFMDIEAKSPLFSQFVEALSGLATVRAFGWEKQLEQRNKKLLDISQKPFYLLWAIQRWLTVVLDLVVAATAVLLMILVVMLRGSFSAGYVGVALVNIITFNQGIKLLITYWTMLETHIGAIARIQNFQEITPSENLPTECQEPPIDWPTHGAITFRNVSAGYK
ncbi:hypothetical protein FQN50_000718 [Emmonsiellopsis sp. PD_5]|nr:hypothetical protein FQN50_000718 [Emmonsiellopsis sp. PD_5]